MGIVQSVGNLLGPLFDTDAGIDIKLTGNGGGTLTSADGGAISEGNINSGANIGNGIQIQDTVGDVTVKGGQISNLTNNDLPADGGLASARSAPGADYDTAFVS